MKTTKTTNKQQHKAKQDSTCVQIQVNGVYILFKYNIHAYICI